MSEPDEASTALAQLVDKLARAPKDTRMAALSAAATRMGPLVRAGQIDPTRVFEALGAAARTCGLAAEVGRHAVATVLMTALMASTDGTVNPVLVRCVADVAAQPIRWLWGGRFALGKLALIAGHPGLGKSQIAAFLAAAVSTGGSLPGGGNAPSGSVLMLSAEDDVADTIRPRLEAAGADLAHVHVVDPAGTPDRHLRGRMELDRDIETLDYLAGQLGDVRLVIIDPLTAYVGGIDAHRQSAVREMLRPVSAFAARHDLAVICVTHLNKGHGDTIMRIAGSLAFVAAARGAHLVVPEPDSDRRLMVPLKNNIGDDRAGLAFRMVERVTPAGIKAPAIVWEDRGTMISAAAALEAAARPARQDGALEEAKDFLRELLAGGPVEANKVKSEASEAGISPITLVRARRELGIKPQRCGPAGSGGKWLWAVCEAQR